MVKQQDKEEQKEKIRGFLGDRAAKHLDEDEGKEDKKEE